MDLSPSEIRSHSFSRSLRGCSPQEVESFLERVADQVASLADARDRMQDRINNLEAKLDEIGDATGKIRSAKSELSQRQSDLAQEEERLTRRRQHLDRRQAKLDEQRDAILQIVSRLQGVMRREINNLQGIDAPSSTSSAAPSPSPSSADTKDTSEREKSTQEWIDSLFPNRLGAAESGNAAAQSSSASPSRPDSSDSPEPGPPSQREAQFEAIKEDVKDRTASEAPSGTTSSDDEEKPSTSELERIWDIFEEK